MLTCPAPPQKKLVPQESHSAQMNGIDTDQLLTSNPVVEMEQRLMG